MGEEYGPARNEATLTPEQCQAVLEQLPKISSLVIWRVKCSWANNGRTGETDDLVVAEDAVSALQAVWEIEDPCDLRNVSIEWMCPADLMKSAGDTSVQVNIVEGS